VREGTLATERGSRVRYPSRMDVLKMLAELRDERMQIEQTILAIEHLASGRGKRRGRPPAWMKEVKRRGRPPGIKSKPKAKAATQG
jgi:hypothetical protein